VRLTVSKQGRASSATHGRVFRLAALTTCLVLPWWAPTGCAPAKGGTTNVAPAGGAGESPEDGMGGTALQGGGQAGTSPGGEGGAGVLEAMGGQGQSAVGGAETDVPLNGAGGNAATDGAVAGSVKGVEFAAVGSYAVVNENRGGVVFAELPNLCALAIDMVRHNYTIDGVHSLLVSFLNGSSPVAAGTYPISPDNGATMDVNNGRVAEAQFAGSEPECRSPRTQAIAGSVTLLEVGPPTMRGHLSLDFPNGERIVGAFVAPSCGDLYTTAPDPSAPTTRECRPHE
jgi:hypothetical protein